MGKIETNLGAVMIVHSGAHNSTSAYSRLRVVEYNGSSYISIQDVPENILISDTNYWRVICKGALQIWVEQGHTGNYADFIAWLQEPANSAAQTAVDTINNIVSAVTEAETLRATAETNRINAENARVVSETARNVASNIYNVTLAVPLAAGQYYTSTTARAAVPVGVRKRGLELVYETSAGVWFSERFIGSDVAAWTTATNWERLPMTADFKAFLPAVPFSNRVLADGGSVRNKQALFDSFKTALDLLPNTVLAFSPEIGVKQSVNGLVYKASKLYDMSPFSNDANQATAGLQPYIGGNIAPNERMWLWGLSKTIPFTPISFNATDKWSISIVADIVGSSADFIGSSNTRITYNNAATDSITFKNESATSVSFNVSKFGGTRRIYLVAQGNGSVQVWINGFLQGTITNQSNVTLNTIYSSLNAKGKSIRVFNKDLSKSEIEGLDKFLASIYSEHETTNIGSQAWLTSNHIGNVTSDGFVIPEVQGNDAASNPELITNAADREFSSDTGFWIKTAQVTIGGGICNIKSTDGSVQSLSKAFLTAGKTYKISLEIVANRGGSLRMQSTTEQILFDSTVGVKVIYIRADGSSINIVRQNAPTDIDIDNLSIKECGWSDSQAVYDYYISAGKSVLEASQAAAMCCKYNNSDDNAAVYGYILNGHAHNYIKNTAPKGLRLGLNNDWTQLFTALGGNSVAGKKLKKEGIAYWSTTNSGTNESGFTAIGGGRRNADGTFANIGTEATFRAADGNVISILNNSDAATSTAADLRIGTSLRFLKNAAVGDLFEEIDTTTFTQNIATSQRELAVKFGYSIEAIIVYSSTNLTNIKVEARTTAGVLLATLLPTGSTTAGVPFEFKVTQGMPIQLQDYKLWITATGNSADGMRVICNTKKSIL